MKLSIVVLAVMLGACATQEEIDERNRLALEQQQMREKAYVDGLANRCAQFGFQSGTADHRQCVLSLHQQNQANFGALLQGAAAAQIMQDGQRRNQPLVQPVYPAPARTQNCSPDYRGGMTCTTQ